MLVFVIEAPSWWKKTVCFAEIIYNCYALGTLIGRKRVLTFQVSQVSNALPNEEESSKGRESQIQTTCAIP